MARALVSEQSETHLRNAQDELREEHTEIAIYTRIEALATEVGDRETAKLARDIRRDEERMAKYLIAEVGRLVKDVVRAEIPRDQRATSSRGTLRAALERSTPLDESTDEPLALDHAHHARAVDPQRPRTRIRPRPVARAAAPAPGADRPQKKRRPGRARVRPDRPGST